MSRSRWIDSRVDAFLAVLSDLGMSISRAAAGEIIAERIQWLSTELGISPVAARKYLGDDTLRDLAYTMAFAFADETPGADLLTAPRTVAVPVPVLARTIAGLAEAIQVRLQEPDDTDHLRTTVGQLAHSLSALGQLCAEPVSHGFDDKPVITLPPGLVNRAARYLEAAAELVNGGVLPDGLTDSDAGQLAATFARDAAVLRALAHTRPER